MPVNLRQSGNSDAQMLISTRIRKSPWWHLSKQAGAWAYTTYNHVYHPRAYIKPEDGGLMEEYRYLTDHVTMWDVACERQIQVKGPDAAEFVNLLITRDVAKVLPTMSARYVILCNQFGGIINDPVLLRVADDEFWFSISDSDVLLWAAGRQPGRRIRRRDQRDRRCPCPDTRAEIGGANGEDVRTKHPRDSLLRVDTR